jgi:hypothetical protein
MSEGVPKELQEGCYPRWAFKLRQNRLALVCDDRLNRPKKKVLDSKKMQRTKIERKTAKLVLATKKLQIQASPGMGMEHLAARPQGPQNTS